MLKQSHYSEYNVMDAQDEWDDHTQSIVSSRLIREKPYTFLTMAEAEILRALCSFLVDDSRGDVLQYVLCHFDQTLSQTIGESERKAGVPKASVLLREGLRKLDQSSLTRYTNSFIQLEKTKQEKLLKELSESADQQNFFKKLLNLTLEAYYSHPVIWSEIGYGGPAYPRGYIRTQLGQLDPWEAQSNP
jgi:hypothetical protein